MTRARTAALALLALAAVAASGCGSTAAHRARQYGYDTKSAEFARLERGVLAAGDTRLMAYVAYGPPDTAPRIVYGGNERWEYLGRQIKTPAEPQPLPNPHIAFASSNGAGIDNPFSKASLVSLGVDFDKDGRVVAFTLLPADGRSVKRRPSSAFRIPSSPFKTPTPQNQ